MEQRLFVLLLFTGVALSIPRKYYLIKDPKNMTDARAYCQANHTDLAVYESSSDLLNIQIVSQIQNFSAGAWIGLYNDVKSWRWANGDEPLGVWTRWSGVEPDNADGCSECAVIFQNYWFDMKCTSTRPFICFDDRNSGTDQYVYYTSLNTWSEARSYCRQYHTDLASSRSLTENSLIQGKITLINAATWIGLFRDSWKWMDHTPFTGVTWTRGEPNNAAKDENCVRMMTGNVSDVSCSRLFPFFCHRLITGQQQVIRMKIESDQDVNKPPVKDEILEEILQKLRGRGLQNVTIKFREMPLNNLVFLKMRKAQGLKPCGI